jgi:hypothetical protein
MRVINCVYADIMNTHMLRHLLAALAHRFHKTVQDAPAQFADLNAGYGIRTPLAIVHHMNGVLGYAKGMLEGADVQHTYHHPHLDWQGEVDALHSTLSEMDTLLERQHVSDEMLERLMQGPVADAMTHVGQLAILRRIAGSPIASENFYRANIQAGQVSAQQPPAVAPDANQNQI